MMDKQLMQRLVLPENVDRLQQCLDDIGNATIDIQTNLRDFKQHGYTEQVDRIELVAKGILDQIGCLNTMLTHKRMYDLAYSAGHTAGRQVGYEHGFEAGVQSAAQDLPQVAALLGQIAANGAGLISIRTVGGTGDVRHGRAN
jgi:hypothetical protein